MEKQYNYIHWYQYTHSCSHRNKNTTPTVDVTLDVSSGSWSKNHLHFVVTAWPNFRGNNCWWFRNPANQLSLVVSPIIFFRTFYIPGVFSRISEPSNLGIDIAIHFSPSQSKKKPWKWIWGAKKQPKTYCWWQPEIRREHHLGCKKPWK